MTHGLDDYDTHYDNTAICGQCGSPCEGKACEDNRCECCREANEAELRAALHLHNTLAFVEQSLGLR